MELFVASGSLAGGGETIVIGSRSVRRCPLGPSRQHPIPARFHLLGRQQALPHVAADEFRELRLVVLELALLVAFETDLHPRQPLNSSLTVAVTRTSPPRGSGLPGAASLISGGSLSRTTGTLCSSATVARVLPTRVLPAALRQEQTGNDADLDVVQPARRRRPR